MGKPTGEQEHKHNIAFTAGHTRAKPPPAGKQTGAENAIILAPATGVPGDTCAPRMNPLLFTFAHAKADPQCTYCCPRTQPFARGRRFGSSYILKLSKAIRGQFRPTIPPGQVLLPSNSPPQIAIEQLIRATPLLRNHTQDAGCGTGSERVASAEHFGATKATRQHREEQAPARKTANRMRTQSEWNIVVHSRPGKAGRAGQRLKYAEGLTVHMHIVRITRNMWRHLLAARCATSMANRCLKRSPCTRADEF